MPSSNMHNAPLAKWVVLQASSRLHVVIIKDITHVAKRIPMPEGILPSKHPLEAKQPVSKLSPMCKSITPQVDIMYQNL